MKKEGANQREVMRPCIAWWARVAVGSGSSAHCAFVTMQRQPLKGNSIGK